MKKILLALFIASATLLSFSSCTKEYYPVEPATQTFLYTANPGDWEGQGTPLLNAVFEVPELTNHYVDYGVVNLSISFDNEETFFKLPATVDGVSYHYQYTLGRVDVWAQDPIDEDLSIEITQSRQFKVSLTEGR